MAVWNCVWKGSSIMKITQANVGKLSDGVYTVETGLYLRVRGKYRNYFVRLQVDGKRRDIGIGSAADIPLSVARAKATALRAEALAGNARWGEKEKKTELPLIKNYALEVVKRLDETKRWRGGNTRYEYERCLKEYAFPIIGDKPVTEITRDDMLMVLAPIWERIPQTANRLRSVLNMVFDAAAADGLTDKRSPAAWVGNLELFLAPPKKVIPPKHFDAAALEEAQKLARIFYGSSTISHKATLMLMLTASRRGEVLPAKWSEFDFVKRIWSVPPERRKDGKLEPHRVPMSKQLIKVLQSIEKRGVYVFQSRFFEKPISSNLILESIKKYADRKSLTAHGFRSTFSDWCTEAGIDWQLTEKALMHATGNNVRLAYQRSDLLEQRRDVMQRWADALIEGSAIE